MIGLWVFSNSNLALQEFQLHNLEAAIDAFHAALEYHRKVGNEDGLAATYGQLGKTFPPNGRFPKSRGRV